MGSCSLGKISILVRVNFLISVNDPSLPSKHPISVAGTSSLVIMTLSSSGPRSTIRLWICSKASWAGNSSSSGPFHMLKQEFIIIRMIWKTYKSVVTFSEVIGNVNILLRIEVHVKYAQRKQKIYKTCKRWYRYMIKQQLGHLLFLQGSELKLNTINKVTNIVQSSWQEKKKKRHFVGPNSWSDYSIFSLK